MGLRDFFKPVNTWSADQVREYLKDRDPGEYNLIDVRLPNEYEEEHLSGAQLIPVGDLPSRVQELDPAKPTITY